MAPVVHRVGGEGPPLLLIHGFGADRLGWAATSPALMAHFSVWAAELPGHGTAQPGPSAADEIADALFDLLASLTQADEPICLIGHSLGGAVAAHMVAKSRAKMDREIFGKSVLLSPAGFGAGAPDSVFLRAFPKLKEETEALDLLKRLVVRERLIVPAMAAHVLGHLAKPGRREALSAMAEAAIVASPAPLTLPDDALVVWGEDDQINPPRADGLAGLGERALVLPQIGHLPHVEAATRVNRAMVAHLLD